MQQLTWQKLAGVGLAALVLAWLVTDQIERRGATPLPVPWSFDVVCLAAGALALWLGWQVRQYLRGKRPSLDGLRAARTVAYAQACAYVGAIIAGACGGYALGLLESWGHGPRRDVIISGLIAAACAVGMMVAGIVVERWCRHGGDLEDAESAEPQPA
ncbi:DUF3180 domain-containing protein [Demequina sp. NBRC 110053]|uniref:DUF3180 domain-containing protein n=1 Tax=Demequina sp. NBRC 110053 TaxID=1570342 RepID=UPI0013564E05|nr:DUF3180 domain-containing protein [Demequina sp. NBRC 110053]